MKNPPPFPDSYWSKFSDDPVVIKPFDPGSKQIAQDYIKKLKALTSHLNVESIYHRGSTALGIAGKGDIEIGLIPNSEPAAKLVPLNKLGEVPISCDCETTMLGLYAAGDVTDVPEKQIVIAAGEGAKAALQAHRYLQRL